MTSIHNLLAEFSNTMYQEPSGRDLHTGDIVRLSIEDFKKILRYESMERVLEQYLKDPNYSTGLWAILNQPCDMVHDDEKKRQMKGSLFLAPLQGLRAALKKGIPAGDVLHYINMPKVENVLTDSYRSYLEIQTRTDNPRPKEESNADYQKRINGDYINPAIDGVKRVIQPIIDETEEPTDLLEVLVDSTKEHPTMNDSLKSFASSTEWTKAIEKFNEQKKQVEDRNNLIILKSKSSEDILAKLCLNQLDSQGLFFFEPHPKISDPKHDLAFVIKLDDLLTLKINKDVLAKGDLHKILVERRHLCLTENFSDRLLNIMGNYFSKIGTNDVMSGTVLDLYTQIYPDTFFASDSKYQDFVKNKK